MRNLIYFCISLMMLGCLNFKKHTSRVNIGDVELSFRNVIVGYEGEERTDTIAMPLFYKSEEYEAMPFVIIGNQMWASKNFDESCFRNGDVIAEAGSHEEWNYAFDNKIPAWCYYDFDPQNGKKYGKLYNYYAVNDFRRLVPQGWFIPTDHHWVQLIYSLGKKHAFNKLISGRDWNNEKGNNKSGFSALPAGKYENGRFYGLGNQTTFWSYENNTTKMEYVMRKENGVLVSWINFTSKRNDFMFGGGPENHGYSIRCFRYIK